MSFLTLILKNPFRNRSRALLAILGIGIGIATIVALGAITTGLTDSIDDSLHAAGSDFSISGKNNESAQLNPLGISNFNSSWVDKIKDYKGVSKAIGVYVGIAATEDSPMFSFAGLNPEDYKVAEIYIYDGKIYENDTNQIIFGKLAAEKFNKTVGDDFVIANKSYKIVGLFETGDSNQDTGAFTSLSTAREMMNDKEDTVSLIYVMVDKGEDPKKVANNIENDYNESINVISSAEDIKMIKETMDMLNGATWGISLLAIFIGSIGIINTMLMTVFERTKEIGVLKSVGWSKKRILSMITGESVVISIVSAVVGSIMGVIAVYLLKYLNLFGNLTPSFGFEIFAQGFVVAIIVGILGGLFPAIKASRLPPTEALRYD